MDNKKTQVIKVSEELWNYLASQKDSNGRTFEDVIWSFIRYPMEEEINTQEPENRARGDA